MGKKQLYVNWLKVKQLRDSKFWTQQELADEFKKEEEWLKTSVVYISKLETNYEKSPMRAKQFRVLCWIFNVQPEYLLK